MNLEITLNRRLTADEKSLIELYRLSAMKDRLHIIRYAKSCAGTPIVKEVLSNVIQFPTTIAV